MRVSDPCSALASLFFLILSSLGSTGNDGALGFQVNPLHGQSRHLGLEYSVCGKGWPERDTERERWCPKKKPRWARCYKARDHKAGTPHLLLQTHPSPPTPTMFPALLSSCGLSVRHSMVHPGSPELSVNSSSANLTFKYPRKLKGV